MFRKLYIISRVHIIIVGLKKNKESVVMHSPYMIKRKVRDSNPRYPKRVYRISSPAQSITLPTFQICECKGTINF